MVFYAMSVNTRASGYPSGISTGLSSHQYRGCVENQPHVGHKSEEIGGPRLWRQMVIGFIFAACLGFIMLILGSIFIAEAVASKYTVTVMLCVMGIVCGLIILAGSGILGRMFISRKWRIAHSRPLPQQPPHACFHTCSVIYTPSQDQLAQGMFMDPPPPYESVMLNQFQVVPRNSIDSDSGEEPNWDGQNIRQVQAVMALPPKYTDAVAPIPPYGEQV